jgi:ABC-type transport system involved in multi-copper enzyme maturation permease subunit
MNDRTLDSAVWRSALMWKEFRQLVPLALTVLALGLGMLMLILVTTSFMAPPLVDANQYLYVFLSVPMIYACGVGILLVGAEKESRSLRWLQSLPVSSRDIARTKLMVALMSLAAVWFVTLMAWLLFTQLLGMEPSVSRSVYLGGGESLPLMLVTSVAVSIFLCLAGLGLAWYFHSAMVSLLLLIPSTLAVSLTAYGIANFLSKLVRDSVSEWSLDSGVYLACLTLGYVIALALGWVASQRELSARTAPRSASGWLGLKVAMRSERTAEAWVLWPRTTPGTGMLWQMVRQSWMLWTAVALFCALWLLIAGPIRLFDYSDNYMTRNVISRDSSVPLWMIGLLLILWMGVFAYQGDSIAQRVRFYADRGVSPSLLWWTRHWVPLTILLGLGLARYWSLRPNNSLDLVETFAYLAIALAIYITGQWVSQLIASPIISAIAAPIAAVAMGLYCLSAAILMGAPWWIFIATFAILLGATWWMMKPWMERRIDWTYYVQHSAIAAIALTIPWLPGLWGIWNLPSMASATRTELVRFASGGSPAMASIPFVPGPQFVAEGNDSVSTLLDSNEQVRQTYRRTLIRRAGDVGFWLSGNGVDVQLALFKAELSALRSEISSATTASQQETSSGFDDYRTILSHVPQIVRTLRDRRQLKACDLAERIELVALRECLQPQARDQIGELLYRSLLKFLANGQTRDDARRKALASDWYDQSQMNAARAWFRNNTLGDYDLGFWDLQDLRFTGVIPLSIRITRERDLYAARLWDLLDSAAGSSEAKAKREVQREQFLLRRDDLCDVVDGVILVPTQWYEPAITWRGDWETIPADLISKGQNRE